jgi:hypothetical protein
MPALLEPAAPDPTADEPPPAALSINRALTSLANVKKASSTCVFALADVSTYLSPSSSASALPCSAVTTCEDVVFETNTPTIVPCRSTHPLLVPIRLVAYKNL